MYQNLKAEMARANLTNHDIARSLAKDERSIRNRFNGKTPFTLPEAVRLRDVFFPGVSLDYLFDNSCTAPALQAIHSAADELFQTNRERISEQPTA